MFVTITSYSLTWQTIPGQDKTEGSFIESIPTFWEEPRWTLVGITPSGDIKLTKLDGNDPWPPNWSFRVQAASCLVGVRLRCGSVGRAPSPVSDPVPL